MKQHVQLFSFVWDHSHLTLTVNVARVKGIFHPTVNFSFQSVEENRLCVRGWLVVDMYPKMAREVDVYDM